MWNDYPEYVLFDYSISFSSPIDNVWSGIGFSSDKMMVEIKFLGQELENSNVRITFFYFKGRG